MPQWTRDRDGDRTKYPDERWSSRCPRADASLLLRYDHHVVRIDQRPALLRTYTFAEQSEGEWADELPFEVSFTYAAGHPTAPADVQQVVDRLTFTAQQ